MSESTDAPAGAGATALAPSAPANDTPRGLSDMLAQARQTPDDAPDEAAPETELAPVANAAPEGDPGETTKEADPAEEPPIERPRSWSKDDDDDWNALPRARQEKIAANERAREADIRQRINEAAETRKAAEAERQQVERTNKALAAKLPEIDNAIMEFVSHKYPDLRSMDDVVRMAHEAERLSETDPFASLQLGNRLKAWEVDQQRIASLRQAALEAKSAEDRGRQDNLSKYQAEETEKLAEFVPEVKDPEKLKALTGKAIDHLKNFVKSEQDLNEYAAQGEKPFIFSAAFQRILLQSMKYEDVQRAKVVASAQPAPPVQRPGTAKPQGAAQSANIQTLSAKLERSGDHRDLGALLGALRRA